MAIYIKLLFNLVFFFSAGSIYAQSIVLSGTVTNKATREPMTGVLITLRPEDENKIVDFTQTNATGTYKIKLSTFPQNYILYFSMMGFSPQIISLKSHQQIYNVQLTEKATELKEVIVKAPGIHQRGDTITYIVSSFADAQDKSLADVLKKMPGIEIEKSGAIKYNGVSINKFYIEGKDLLGGRYGLATSNMHQKDVGSVEVMENHQPIKALEDISFSQNPAINIRLKEDAKARWVGTAKLGAGINPFLWNTELFAMRFTPKTQTLNTYKTNNTGMDVTRETMSFSIDEILAQFSKDYNLYNHIQVHPDYLTDIDANRMRFNETHMFSTNNLWSLGKDYDLTSQITYTNNRLTSDNFTGTSYFLEDTTILTETTEHAFSKQNRLSGDLTLTANSPTYYFKNKLYADLRWEDVTMDISGTFPNRQLASTPHRQISNDLEIIKRTGKKAYTINSFNQYQVKPQHLTVVRSGARQQQDVRSSAFNTNTNTSLAFYVNPVTLSVELGVVGVIYSLESELLGVSDTLGSLNNNLTMRYLNLYMSPEIEYRKRGLEAKFEIPLSFVPYSYHDKVEDKKEKETKLFVSPRVYIRYHFTSRLSTSISGRYVQSPVDEQLFYEGLILNNYRNLSLGFIDYKTGNNKSVRMNITYKNPLKAFFLNAGATRSWGYSPRSSNRYFLNEFLLNTYIPQDNYSDIWMLSSIISKGVDAIKGMISIRSAYNTFDGSMFQNGIEDPYATDDLSISPKINSRIAKWCNASYELYFSKNQLEMKHTNTRSSYKNISQVITCNITPADQWYFQLTGEHYYNEITSDVSKHLLIADAEFTYSFKSDWEFNLQVKNIFDQHTYSYTTYDGLTSMSKQYNIRPRNVMASVFFRF